MVLDRGTVSMETENEYTATGRGDREVTLGVPVGKERFIRFNSDAYRQLKMSVPAGQQAACAELKKRLQRRTLRPIRPLSAATFLCMA